jgi:hypothetical protein
MVAHLGDETMIQPPTILSRQRRIDWPRIVSNLQSVGLSLQQIADELGVGKRTVGGYSSEDLPAEPAYWTGHCLLALWCSRCGTQLADVPIKVVQTSVSEMLRDMA